MRAENCTRYGAEVGGERLTYDNICRRFVCDKCGGVVGHTWVGAGGDKVACARCGSKEIISQSRYDKQVSDALEETYIERDWKRRTGMGLLDVIEKGRKGRTERIGVIRLGWTEPYGDGPGMKPVASDHFVLTDAPALVEIFGEKPPALPIRFPHATFDRNILASYMVWAGGKRGGGICLCEGNGKKVLSALPFTATAKADGTASVKRANGDRRVSYGAAATDFTWDEHSFKVGDEVPCPGSAGGLYTHCGACNPSILLKIQIRHPEIASFGYWQITTRSINNYLHLMETWENITKGGKIDIPMSMVPFVLSIKPGATLFQNQRDKSWGTREAFYLNLAVDPEAVALLDANQTRRFVELMQGRPQEVPQLEAPGPEEPDFQPWEDAEFEPVDEVEPEPEASEPEHRVKPRRRSFKVDALDALMEKGWAKDRPEAMATLNLSGVLIRDDPLPRIVAWAALYVAQVTKGVDIEEAAAAADKMIPQQGVK